MICFMCKGTTHEKFSTFTTDMGGCIIVIKNVPSSVCGQCGEVTYANEVAKHLEKIIHSISNSSSTEIAVVSYSEKAA